MSCYPSHILCKGRKVQTGVKSGTIRHLIKPGTERKLRRESFDETQDFLSEVEWKSASGSIKKFIEHLERINSKGEPQRRSSA